MDDSREREEEPVINDREGAKGRPDSTGTSLGQLHQGTTSPFPAKHGEGTGQNEDRHRPVKLGVTGKVVVASQTWGQRSSATMGVATASMRNSGIRDRLNKGFSLWALAAPDMLGSCWAPLLARGLFCSRGPRPCGPHTQSTGGLQRETG